MSKLNQGTLYTRHFFSRLPLPGLIIPVLFVLGCLFFPASCKRTSLMTYSKDKTSLNIWLGDSVNVSDSLTYNFAYTIAGTDSILFHYRLTGYPLDSDSHFELLAVAGDTDKVSYSFGTYTIKAGQYQGSYPIYINKPANYQEFTNSTGQIIFKLKSSDTFTAGVEELDSLNVLFKNYVAKPDNWDAATYPYFALSKYFGSYSNVKYSFVIQTTGMANFQVYYTVVQDPVLNSNTITSTQATYFKQLCKVALQEYNAANGTLLDENNNEVVFP